MLKRQKILLNILNQCGGDVSRLNLVKIAFLLSQETLIGDGIAFCFESYGGKTQYRAKNGPESNQCQERCD